VATFAPPTLVALADLYVANGGVNLGIVGDTAHAALGTSYHLGKSQLRLDAYSRQLPRDKAGLSEAASAFDFGKLNGTLVGLQAFSRDLVARCQVGGPGFDDVREIIYSPDGVAVRRWDNVDKVLRTGGDGTNQGDDSHRYHTHVSWFRDAEKRDHTTAFRPYFEDNMKFIYAIDGKLLTLPLGAVLYGFDGSEVTKTASARDWPVIGAADGHGNEIVIKAGTGAVYPDGQTKPTYLIAKTGTLVDAPAPVVVAADCSAEVAAAITADRAKAKVTWS
jgi:hypothetical protein